MKEDIDQMQERHEKEVRMLQEHCEHKDTRRMPFMWAPGHFGGDVEVCDFCGTIVKSYDMQAISFSTYSDEGGEK